MRIPRVYIDQPLQLGQQVELPSDRAHYVANVLRLAPGRPLILFNGQGGEYSSTLVNTSKKSATVQLDSFDPVDRESSLDLELAIGLSRGDRMDWVIQKATELGVSRISLLDTERSEVKLKADRAAKKMSHWQQVIISACEQCQRNRLPVLNAPRDFGALLAQCDSKRKLILHPTCDSLEPASMSATDSITVLIGPEGGFSEEEVEIATDHGFTGWQLGSRILRTETAPIAALAILQFALGDLGR
ncbi:16S rRNA (uracil(1498)-N(3))-methyltransferase [Proteobacteria bacterium 005FR1]|nr:16S rRNA (uracil(1498)-N(3))-methyltransferase [Proteobacteria bacterium 005FR1]